MPREPSSSRVTDQKRSQPAADPGQKGAGCRGPSRCIHQPLRDKVTGYRQFVDGRLGNLGEFHDWTETEV